MDNESQVQLACGGRPPGPGAVNYRNKILIDIIERLLPPGLEDWREVALEYQRESTEMILCHGEDVHDSWVKKLCKNTKKPTGKPNNILDRHFRCLAIERPIQDRANAAILGVDSTESNHDNNDGSKESNANDDGADAYDGVTVTWAVH